LNAFTKDRYLALLVLGFLLEHEHHLFLCLVPWLNLMAVTKAIEFALGNADVYEALILISQAKVESILIIDGILSLLVDVVVLVVVLEEGVPTEGVVLSRVELNRMLTFELLVFLSLLLGNAVGIVV
jgi:hypothetical protein